MNKFLLALAITFMLNSNASCAEKTQVRANDFVTHKELAQIKLNGVKENNSQNFELLKERIDAQQNLLDIQTARISDLTIYLGAFAIILAVLAIFAGWFGFITVTNRAKEEAKKAANEWFTEHGQKQIEKALADFEDDLESKKKLAQDAVDEISKLQAKLQFAPARAKEAVPSMPAETDPLQLLVEQLKQKPESDYAFADWNARAFDAYRQGKFSLAAEYWLRAANSRNPSRGELAVSISNAGVALIEDGKHERALELYNDLLARFGTATELPLREQVARALVNKGNALRLLTRYEEAINVCDEVLARFGTATELPLREQVARALLSKGAVLDQLTRYEEAISLCNEILARYGTATELPLRVQVAAALASKGGTLHSLNRYEEAIEVYGEVLARFGTATEPPLREQVGIAETGKGFAQLITAKQRWREDTERRSRLQHALECFDRALNGPIDRPIALGNKAYALFLLGRIDEAREPLRQALADGGVKLKDAEIKDTESFTVHEDEGFRSLISNLWNELHPGHDV